MPTKNKKKSNTTSTCRQGVRDIHGRFVKGVSGNPQGSNQFTTIVPLLEALERKGQSKKETFWDMVAKKCWKSDQVLIAVLKKIVPDKLDQSEKPLTKEQRDECTEHLRRLGIIKRQGV
uniref:DUF5681 domain-containing protein n=1 Tax=viral metagenome TaxID=1070528 RepID=A0A6M3IJG3_9ZZZZ